MLARVTRRVPKWTPSRGLAAASAPFTPPPPPQGITHDVLNQGTLPEGENLFTRDPILPAGVAAMTAGGAKAVEWAQPRLTRYGMLAGSVEAVKEAERAHRHPPVFERFDRQGRLHSGQVDYDPAYHAVLRRGLEEGRVPSLAWNNAGRTGAHVARGALGMMGYQTEPGTSCPMSMTYAAVSALLESRELAPTWVPGLRTPVYDPTDVPSADKVADGGGLTAGMSMTEKQGGSDVGANTSTATPLEGSLEPGSGFALRGHKWFTSAPHSDVFLTLAHVPSEEGKGRGGSTLSCFLVPRWMPDGSPNRGLQFQRLKDKLGDKSNASSEVHYDNAYGVLLGPVGRGVATIIPMVQATREDCALGSAGLARAAVVTAGAMVRSRAAFGAPLGQQPLMRGLLADLSLETEVGVLAALGVSATFDDIALQTGRGDAGGLLGGQGSAWAEAGSNGWESCGLVHSALPAEAGNGGSSAAVFRRLLTAVMKYSITKRAPGIVVEALECLGGNGFVETFPMARMYRQAPLNSIWEGSGNVQALDILRTVAREPESLSLFLTVVEETRDVSPRVGAHLDALRGYVSAMAKGEIGPLQAQAQSRALAESLALAYYTWAAVRASTQAGSPSIPTSLGSLADAWVAARYPSLNDTHGGLHITHGPNTTYGTAFADPSAGHVTDILSRLNL